MNGIDGLYVSRDWELGVGCVQFGELGVVRSVFIG